MTGGPVLDGMAREGLPEDDLWGADVTELVERTPRAFGNVVRRRLKAGTCLARPGEGQTERTLPVWERMEPAIPVWSFSACACSQVFVFAQEVGAITNRNYTEGEVRRGEF